MFKLYSSLHSFTRCKAERRGVGLKPLLGGDGRFKISGERVLWAFLLLKILRSTENSLSAAKRFERGST